MEDCGIAAGDEFLKTELTAIMNSRATIVLNTKTGHVYPPVTVGSYPVAAAITW